MYILRILLVFPASAAAATIAYIAVGLLLYTLKIACSTLINEETICIPPDPIAWFVLFFLLSLACSAAWVLAGYFMLPFRSRKANWMIFGSGAIVSLHIALYFGLVNMQVFNYIMGTTVLLISWITGIVITRKLNRGIASNV